MSAFYDELVLVIGPESADRLVERFGGKCIFPPVAGCPPGPPQDRWRQVVEHIGREAADLLSARYGHTRLYVPLNVAARRAWQRQEIARLAAAGLSDNEIADRVAYTVKPSANQVALIRRRLARSGSPGGRPVPQAA